MLLPVFASCLSAFSLATLVSAAPAASSSAAAVPSSASQLASSPAASQTVSAPEATATVPYASADPNAPMWGPDDSDTTLAPIRGSLGAPIMGPENYPLEQQNPDLLAPPTTDAGSVSNAKWPFSLSHNRMQTGGWARQENIGVMPIATSMASVNMRLEPGAIRELHWHKTSEVLGICPQGTRHQQRPCAGADISSQGSTQVTSVDAEGRNFLATVGPGDLWFFPPGIPHSLQATNDSAGGSEFILVFDDGAFSEDSTFLLTDWLAHVPAEVIQKNFQANPDAFSHIPAKELYIFPSEPPSSDAVAPDSPQGQVPNPFTFALSKVNGTKTAAGSVKIVDSTSFTVCSGYRTPSRRLKSPLNLVLSGKYHLHMCERLLIHCCCRELHWHPTMDEWSFFIEGQGRVTIFASQGNARTFNYQPGDIGFVPTAMGHYVENTGNTTLRYLEIFNTDKYQDISLNQWLALTPPDLVKAHLQLSDETIASLSKTKPVVIGPKDAAPEYQ
ncbi:Oxalate decarboxylase [Mycena indigotica]|uniref:Oxalate decarboxylase n=1 Tax=Mycena indigotica TaxID=2126181 RepID=A0A8H6T548_9AGAR|nr:Oxalate decarboxylase [Mycena indigotica]KAF7311938.1 Oxalate decarboxylase [Mycena indigotica]